MLYSWKHLKMSASVNVVFDKHLYVGKANILKKLSLENQAKLTSFAKISVRSTED